MIILGYVVDVLMSNAARPSVNMLRTKVQEVIKIGN